METDVRIELVLQEQDFLQRVYTEAMKEGLHYGLLPQADKPCLYLPGAHLLARTYKLRDSLKVTQQGQGDGPHKTYSVTCTLENPEGMTWDGVGICSTLEARFRWVTQYQGQQFTGEPVPRTYWEIREKEGAAKARDWLTKIYDADTFPRKGENGWELATGGTATRVENPDIADSWNTVLKIAKKRAFVDAVLMAVGCSDIFTQDLEDMDQPDAPEAQESASAEPEKPASSETAKTADKRKKKPTGASPEDFPEGWRRARVTIGGKRSAMTGKLLGELNTTQLHMLDRMLGMMALGDEEAALWSAVKTGIKEGSSKTAKKTAKKAAKRKRTTKKKAAKKKAASKKK